MPRISEMVESRFLKKEEVGTGIIATIKDLVQYNVAPEGKPEEMKYCLEFREDLKPMPLNPTNMHILEAITGSDNSDDWMGLEVVLFNDPSVIYNNIRGGLRIRANTAAAPTRAPQKPAQGSRAPAKAIPDEEIPFS